jgi:hypothetical protein
LMLKNLNQTFLVRSDGLLITSPERANTMAVTRAYDVADFVVTHDQAGNVQNDYGPLLKAIAGGQELGSSRSVSQAVSRPFSNGAIQVLIVRAADGRQDEIAAVLAGLHEVGRRDTRDGPKVPGPAGSQPSQSQLRMTMLPGEAAIQKALAANVSADFPGMPLTDMFDYFRDATRIPIQPDISGLSDAGINLSVPVTLQASGGITLRAALAQALSPIKLTWTIQDEVLLITTEAKAAAYLVTRVYAVNGLAKSDLPATSDTKVHGVCELIESDAVRALVVMAPYAVQEDIAAKLARLGAK